MKACKVSPTPFWIQYIAEVQVSDITQCKWNTKGPTDLARRKTISQIQLWKLKGLMGEKPSSHQSKAENRTLLLCFFKLSMQPSNPYCQSIKHPTWTSRCWRHWTQPTCNDQNGFPGAFPAHPYGSTWAGSTTHWTNSQCRAVPTQTQPNMLLGWPADPSSILQVQLQPFHIRATTARSWAGPPNLGASSQLLSASSEHTNGRKCNSKAWKEIPVSTEGKYSKDLFNNTHTKKS